MIASFSIVSLITSGALIRKHPSITALTPLRVDPRTVWLVSPFPTPEGGNPAREEYRPWAN